jgi:hypothetical protein
VCFVLHHLRNSQQESVTVAMSDEVSISSKSMKKWGIPVQQKQTNELTLLERLVWVEYKGHWWPALLYQDYSELQSHLYDKLDMVVKAQFAMAIMRQMQDSSKIRVARLLGRKVLEVVEVEGDNYADFYWQLPRVLPGGCQKQRYGSNTELYLDFHRALDQVEEIIRDVSENSFNLLPSHDHKTWLERALANLKDEYASSSTANVVRSAPFQPVPSGEKAADRSLVATPAEDSNPVFQAMDAMMESISKSFDGLTGADTDPSNQAAKVPVPDKYGVVEPQKAPRDSTASIKNRLRALKSGRAMSDTIHIVDNAAQTSSPTTQGSKTLSPSTMDEARDPSPADRKSKGGGYFPVRRSSQRRSSNEVLPGLEADDIVPGLGDVLKAMNMYADEVDSVVPGNGKGVDESQHGQSRSFYKAKPKRGGNKEELFGEMQPVMETSPTKKSAVPYSPTLAHVSEGPPEPTEQRDSSEVMDSSMQDAGARAQRNKRDDTFWEFLTCRAVDI